MKKIRIQIAFAIIGSCLILSMALSFTSSKESLALLNEESTDKLMHLSSRYANEFGIEVKMIENTVKMLHSNIFTTFDTSLFEKDPSAYRNMYLEYLDPIIYQSTLTDNGIQGIYFTLNPELTNEWHEIWYADVEGNRTYKKFDMNVEDISEVNPANEDYDYYFEPVSKMKGIWLSPYYDGLLDVYMISYVEPIVIDGILIGIVGADLRMDDIARDIETMEIYDSGSAILINQEKEIVIHQKPQNKDEAFSNDAIMDYLNSENQMNKNGIVELVHNGENLFFSYAELPNKWYLAIQVPKDEVLEKAILLRATLIWITLGGLLMSSVLAYILSRILGQIIEKNSEKMKETQGRLFETEKIASLVYLVSGVAHEINTPVGNCITLSTYIEEESKSTLESIDNKKIDKSHLVNNFQMIQDAAKHIYVNLMQTQNIINAFKDLAMKKTTYIETRFDVRTVLSEMISAQIKQALPQKVAFDLACGENIFLTGDLILFNQIFLNLIENSMIHGFDNRLDGKITIEVTPIDNGISVDYKDNGKGIDPYALDKIFVPFFSTKFGEKNKGLGMNVVYNITKGTFQGSIEVKNLDTGGLGVMLKLYSAT